MPILKISDAFEVAFIAAANAANDHQDDLDLAVDDDRERIYLSNSCPGYDPYLRIVTREGGEATVEICSTTNIRPDDANDDWQYAEGVEASAAVNLSDLEATAQAVITCWASTL
ncbi:hypothetical protein [Rhodococcus qingshengii]|uniref:Uncharacterized protein n=1 Tax=Rhodococcus qingshengii TaxID=334542 RepID=A0A2A5J101_RHOSG|nr:hypothetical protein [Rhodococcus qingshengii]PCK23268.1 hypothetical protein CHR55_30425 [Rhodococcus qingshengii]